MRQYVQRICNHLTTPGNRQVALGMAWVASFILVGKIAGAAKEMTIAWRYGVSETVDAYVFVFNLVTWPVALWFSILSMVLAPLTARLRIDTPNALARFRAELLGLTLAGGGVLGILVGWGGPVLLRTGFLGLSGTTLTLSLNFVTGMALLIPLGAVVSLFSAWLLVAGLHRNTLFEAIPAMVILVVLLPTPLEITEPLLWGTVLGVTLQLTALGVPLLTRGELSHPNLSLTSPAWQAFWLGIRAMTLGQILMSGTGLVDQFFAAGLGPGALSTLSYANRILSLILGLGATAISRATLPVFSETYARANFSVYPLVTFWSTGMFISGLAILTIGWFSAPWLVHILFERGSFNANDTANVANAVKFGLIQVPFYMAALVFVTFFSGAQKYSFIGTVALVNFLMKFTLNYLLTPSYGIEGLMLATAGMYITAYLMLQFFFHSFRPQS